MTCSTECEKEKAELMAELDQTEKDFRSVDRLIYEIVEEDIGVGNVPALIKKLVFLRLNILRIKSRRDPALLGSLP